MRYSSLPPLGLVAFILVSCVQPGVGPPPTREGDPTPPAAPERAPEPIVQVEGDSGGGRSEATPVAPLGDPVVAEPAGIAGRVIGPDGRGLAGARVRAIDLARWPGFETLVSLDSEPGGADRAGVDHRIDSLRAEAERAPTVESAADGSFALGDLLVGPHRLLVTHSGHLQLRPEVVFAAAGASVERTIELTRGLHVSGKIVDGDGRPIAGARLEAVECAAAVSPLVDELLDEFVASLDGGIAAPRPIATSDESGAFRVGPLPPVHHEIYARAGARASAVFPRQRPGATGVELRWPEGARLTGRVLQAGGQPASGVRVSLGATQAQLEGGGESEMRLASVARRLADIRAEGVAVAETAPDGSFEIRGVRPGSYRLRVPAEGSPASVRPVEIAAADGTAGVVGEDIVELGAVELPAVVALHGRVVGPAGEEVAGAVVDLLAADSRHARPDQTRVETDSEGRFRFDGLVAGEYTVRAWAGASGSGTATLAAGPEPTDLRLEQGRVLAGRVVAAEDGRPLGGARLRLKARVGDPTREAKTDDDGRFELALAADDPTVAVDVRLAGRAPLVRTVSVEESEGEERTWRLYPEQVVRGRVVDESGGPVAAARVSYEIPGVTLEGQLIVLPRLGLGQAFSGVDGAFALNAPTGPLAAGAAKRNVHIRVERPGYAATTARVPWPALARGVATDELPVVLPGGSVLVGTVRDADGQPVPAALVRCRRAARAPTGIAARWRDGATVTGADGSFRVAGLSPGAHDLRVDAVGFAPLVQAAIEAPARDVDVVLDAGAVLEGRVVDHDGQPLAGVNVSAFGGAYGQSIVAAGGLGRAVTARARAWKETDSAGGFRFANLPREPHVVVTRRPGFELRWQPGCEPGAAALDIVMPALGQLALRVNQPDGQGADGFSLVLESPATADAAADGLVEYDAAKDDAARDKAALRTDRRRDVVGDNLELTGLVSGEYRLRVLAPGFPAVERDVEIPAGERVDVTIVLRRGVRVAGRVYDEASGEALAGAKVTLAAPDGVAREVGSDAEGRFVFTSVEDGTYTIDVDVGDYFPARGRGGRRIEVLGAALEGLPLRLRRGGRVEGVVNGLPESTDADDSWSVELAPVEEAAGRPPRGEMREGRFAIRAVPPGRYRVRVRWRQPYAIGPSVELGEVAVEAGAVAKFAGELPSE